MLVSVCLKRPPGSRVHLSGEKRVQLLLLCGCLRDCWIDSFLQFEDEELMFPPLVKFEGSVCPSVWDKGCVPPTRGGLSLSPPVRCVPPCLSQQQGGCGSPTAPLSLSARAMGSVPLWG